MLFRGFPDGVMNYMSCDGLDEQPNVAWYKQIPRRNNMHLWTPIPFGPQLHFKHDCSEGVRVCIFLCMPNWTKLRLEKRRGNDRMETRWFNHALDHAKRHLVREVEEIFKGTGGNVQNTTYVRQLRGSYSYESLPDEHGRVEAGPPLWHHPDYPPERLVKEVAARRAAATCSSDPSAGGGAGTAVSLLPPAVAVAPMESAPPPGAALLASGPQGWL